MKAHHLVLFLSSFANAVPLPYMRLVGMDSPAFMYINQLSAGNPYVYIHLVACTSTPVRTFLQMRQWVTLHGFTTHPPGLITWLTH